MKFPYKIRWQFVGSIDRLILFDVTASFCSDQPDVRAHMYLFALYRKVPATYIYIYHNDIYLDSLEVLCFPDFLHQSFTVAGS